MPMFVGLAPRGTREYCEQMSFHYILEFSRYKQTNRHWIEFRCCLSGDDCLRYLSYGIVFRIVFCFAYWGVMA